MRYGHSPLQVGWCGAHLYAILISYIRLDLHFMLIQANRLLAHSPLFRRWFLTPPQGEGYSVGGGDFHKIGQHFRQHFIELGGLKPDHRVLDVGCGTGRMAVPLTYYLDRQGEYWGFDINPAGIAWCQAQISRRFPNFHFQHVNVYNSFYNPTGTIQPQDYRFPFADATFDFIFLTSIFTHLLPDAMANYLAEVCRTLKSGGRCLITYFLRNPEAIALMSSGQSKFKFDHVIDDRCWAADATHPEAAVAYAEDSVRQLYQRTGLILLDPIHYGSWCGRSSTPSFQDIVIATRP